MSDQEHIDFIIDAIKQGHEQIKKKTDLLAVDLAAISKMERLRDRFLELTSDVVTPGQVLLTPSDGEVIDLSGKIITGLNDARFLDGQPALVNWPSHDEMRTIGMCSTPQRFPLSVKGGTRYTIKNGTVRGRLHRDAPWHVWKLHGDGDGIRFESQGGDAMVWGMWVDNVADGFAPRGTPKYFYLDEVYATSVHDDIVENDEVHNGRLLNSFVQGHTFYSARGGYNPNAQFTVSRCVVELILQPHQGERDYTDINIDDGYPYDDDLGCGCLFKMDWNNLPASGTVNVSDTVFLVPRHSSSSRRAMQFAPGTYSNVKLVWLGYGDYPYPPPNGVEITKDRKVFDDAKAKWFASHSQWKPQS